MSPWALPSFSFFLSLMRFEFVCEFEWVEKFRDEWLFLSFYFFVLFFSFLSPLYFGSFFSFFVNLSTDFQLI